MIRPSPRVKGIISHTNRIRRTTGERIFDSCNIAFMVLLSAIMIYPFWYVLVMSFNSGRDAATGPLWIWPRVFTLANYEYVLAYESLRGAFLVTIARCLIGPILSVCVKLLAAYAMSKRFLRGRRIVLYYFMMPMFIGGSIVSNYLVIVKLGLMNTFGVYVLPGLFGFFDMVIMRTFIENIPKELEESAMLDGAGYARLFSSIVLPLCLPVISAFLFFGVVGHWLDLNTNLFYVTKRSLFVLQYILYQVINSSEANAFIDFNRSAEAVRRQIEAQTANTVPTPEVIKMTVMVVVTFPILFIYPFFQRYFIKGMMVGAIKA